MGMSCSGLLCSWIRLGCQQAKTQNTRKRAKVQRNDRAESVELCRSSICDHGKTVVPNPGENVAFSRRDIRSADKRTIKNRPINVDRKIVVSELAVAIMAAKCRQLTWSIAKRTRLLNFPPTTADTHASVGTWSFFH
ncbi:hypothetical protein MTP99_009000 [Tenebrio molitor]|jgi:hypothetical protein|nr:hypothetical protein MTP99_009000 [Tenebrio molitor]